MQPVTRCVLLSAVLIGLAGCSGTADALGLGRNPPDEFAVVDRPPLSMPPDFDLRPPKPGAPRPQEVKMTERASQTVFGSSGRQGFVSSDSSADKSDSERALLSSAGAVKADASIRDTIDREASQKVSGSQHLVDEILWWHDSSSGSGATVNAREEAERLRQAQEKGEPVNAGATPVIERDKSGWLGL